MLADLSLSPSAQAATQPLKLPHAVHETSDETTPPASPSRPAPHPASSNLRPSALALQTLSRQFDPISFRPTGSRWTGLNPRMKIPVSVIGVQTDRFAEDGPSDSAGSAATRDSCALNTDRKQGG